MFYSKQLESCGAWGQGTQNTHGHAHTHTHTALIKLDMFEVYT